MYFYFLQLYYFATYSLFPYNNFLWGLGHNAFLLLTLMWNQVFWIFKRRLVQGSFYCLKELLPIVFMQFSKIRWFDFWAFPALVCSLTFLLKVSFLFFFLCFFKNNNTILFYFLINEFTCLFWLCWVFVAVRRLSLVAASGGYSSLRFAGFSLRWLLLLQSTGSTCAGFSSGGARAR